ncbi:MAG TPA: class I tRNA ligase family protein [bacterium]|nr:class I tRNA ligase family protein [bacterium]
MSRYYITTPIYYVNDKPHIGHAYTTVVADVLARFHRLLGDETRLVTGTDENSQKNVQAMEKVGESDLHGYLDRMAGTWQKTWKDTGISFDDFIRTTEPRHIEGVKRFWESVKKSGDIYEGEYIGLYCTGCEAFKNDSEVVENRCVLHPNKDLDQLKEKNYFFKFTKYRDQLLALYDESSDFILPEERRNEIRNYVKDHLTDISISREAKAVGVGILVPGDETQVIYVWFDALLNYITAVGYGTDEALFKQWWPADLHLVGKDILKFHCALWPAMIMSAAQSDPLLQDEQGKALLPKRVHAHGFFTINGQKISKSLGNAIDPLEFRDSYGLDAVRYYVLREIGFGSDGDFSHARLQERYESDLGNTLGNLLQRTIAMSRKYANNAIPTTDVLEASLALSKESAWAGREGLEAIAKTVKESLHVDRADQALEAIWLGIGDTQRSGLMQANKLIEETQPFKLVKEDPEAVNKILYALLESLRWYAVLLGPLMPETSQKIFTSLGLDSKSESERLWSESLTWGRLAIGGSLPEPTPLFPRLEVQS